MNTSTNLPILEAYRVLARNLPETTVLMFDDHLRFLVAEGSDLPVLGFSHDRVVGFTLYEALPPELAARYEPYFREALRGHRNVIEETFGDRRSIYQIQFSPARNDDGSVHAGMVICQNVTAQRTAEAKLRDSEGRNRALIHALPDTQLLLDSGGTVLDVFQNALTAQLPAGLPLISGTNVRDLQVPQAVVRKIFMLIEQTLSGQRLMTAEVDLSGDADQPDYAELRCVPMGSARVLLVIRSINELRKTQRSLEARVNELTALHARVSELEQLKTDMLRLGAHDLRNPLMVIMNYSRYVLEDLTAAGGSQQIIQYMTEIREAAERMKMISHDILDAERIEQVLEMTAFVTLDFVSTFQEAADGLRANAALKQHALTVRFPAHPIKGHGDAPMLREAAGNLISNAIKYTPDGGHIEVVLLDEGEQIEFSVIDNGHGIPSEMQDQLFKPMVRAGTKKALHDSGTGFGLYLVKRIIERHAGVLFFESQVGQGSRFGFRLPVTRD